MAKDKITDYSATAASNTDLGGINIQGSAAISNADNAFREVMSHLAETNAGTYPVDDTWTFCDPADRTKKFRFDGVGITAGNTRVITMPDSDVTLGSASATASGLVELATDAETITGTDTARAITPANVAAAYRGTTELTLMAAEGFPAETNGAQGGIRYLTGKPIFYYAFDTTTSESLYFYVAMPKRFNLSTVTFAPYWVPASGSGTVEFEISMAAVSNDDPLDVTLGTAQASADTLILADDLHIGPTTSAVTIGGTPAAQDFYVIKVTRDVANDDLGVDAQLLALKMFYTANLGNDA